MFYATFFSFLILLFIVVYQKKLQDSLRYIKKNIKSVFILGLINPFLYYLVLFKAYDLLPAQEAQAINYTWALMLTFLSVIFLKHKLYLSDIVAGFVCYFGVLVIASKGDVLSFEFSNLYGVLFALLSTILWAIYWIVNTKIKTEPLILVFSNFALGLPLIFVYVLFTQDLHIPSLAGVLGAIYVGFFEMGITFLFWLKAMQSATQTSKIANLIFVSPFLSLVFIYFLLDEKINISTIVGLGLIISGLVIQRLKKEKV